MEALLSLLPPAIVIAIAIRTKKAFEAMIVGALVGFIMTDGLNAIPAFANSLLIQIVDPALSWVILFSLLIGGLMGLIQAAKASSAFTSFALRYAKGEKKTFLLTLILALLVYPDEYLRGMTLNTAMSNLFKKNKVPKEMLTFSLSALGVPLVTLIPATTWAVYFAGLLESSGLAESGGGMGAYLSVIPYSFYPILIVLIYLLAVLGFFPQFGAVKKAYHQIKEGTYDFEAYAAPDEEGSKASLWDFIIPLVVVIVGSIVFGNDMMAGIVCGLLVAFVLYTLKKYVNVGEATAAFWEGAQSMIIPMGIVAVSYTLAEVMEVLGFSDVVYMLKPFLIPQILPALVFIVSCAVCYYTSEFWGMAAILLPAVLPLAIDFGVDPWLCAAAVFGGSVFGSHTCVYGDYNALLAEITGSKQVEVAMTNTPYSLAAAGLSVIIYLVIGFL